MMLFCALILHVLHKGTEERKGLHAPLERRGLRRLSERRMGQAGVLKYQPAIPTHPKMAGTVAMAEKFGITEATGNEKINTFLNSGKVT